MRFAHAIDNTNPTDSPAGDAAAAMFLFAIVGGLLVALVAATIPAVTLGAMLGGAVGVVVAYH